MCPQSMDLLGKLEIYIPVEAEVKSIPLWSLPKSVLGRMGLPASVRKGSGKLADSPEGVWICPAVIRRKGQKLAPHAGDAVENLSSLMGREFRANPGPVQMNFVSANHAVYKVLKDITPGKKGAAPHASPLPRGSAPRTYKDAVILYNGRIYLSIRNPNRSRSRPEAGEPQPAAQSSVPSTSAAPSKSLKKRRSPPAPLEPAEPQRKKSHVALPQTSKQPKDRLPKPGHPSTTDQELLNDSRPKEKRSAPRAPLGEHKKVTAHKGSDVSSTTTAHKADVRRQREADGEQAEEDGGEAAGWFRPPGEQEIEEEEGEEEAEEEANDDGGGGGDGGGECGDPNDSGNPSWTPQGAPRASASIQEFEFQQLAGEEMIARQKAKLEMLMMADH
ncbi:hypothetical protein EYF80_059407 [Liparis tanakae]|uniref:Uncharacterized protein n=1 Tax=Liparis tanakae TaxID=230148 RepID=A0A4Z2EPC0_9TELE|nr:hypothetical protein EYF80_059407 [Liparis tanakae]